MYLGWGAKGGVFEMIMVSLGAGTAAKTKARTEEITKSSLQIREGRPIDQQFIPIRDAYDNNSSPPSF